MTVCTLRPTVYSLEITNESVFISVKTVGEMEDVDGPGDHECSNFSDLGDLTTQQKDKLWMLLSDLNALLNLPMSNAV
jgi:hypothetical protein